MYLRYVKSNNVNLIFYRWTKSTSLLQAIPCFQKMLVTTIYTTNPCSSSGGTGKGNLNITFKPYVAPRSEPHDYKNMKLNRPMSPHLTIVAPTITAMTSIGQRITGVVLAFYVFMVSFGALVLPHGIDSYVSFFQYLNFGRLSLFLIKFIMGLPFAFHYFNGIRFIAWNANKWLKLTDVYHTAKISIIGTGIVAFIFALL